MLTWHLRQKTFRDVYMTSRAEYRCLEAVCLKDHGLRHRK